MHFQLLPPANEVCEGYVFTSICHSVHRGGGGRAWHGGMHCRGHALQGDLCAGDMVTEAGGTHPTVMHSCHSSGFTRIKKALKTYLNHFSSFNRVTQSV